MTTRHVLGAVGLVIGLASPVAGQNQGLVQTGRALYEAQECDRCHMVGGKGYRNGKLDGVAAKMSAADMRAWLTKPSDMEARLDEKPKVRMSSRKTLRLTDSEVTALVAYLSTLR